MPRLPLSPAGQKLALFSLALGGFGIGATEFVAMGLLPNIARDLLPALARVSPADAEAQTGLLISAYALGVVVGAPTIAATTARVPRRTLILSLLAAFTVFTVASAIAPSYPVVLVSRFAAGLPHGAYFGIASLVAADLMGPGKSARAVSLVLSGLTIANVVGVPSITWLGQIAGWRVAYFAVATIFLAAFLAVAATVPATATREGASVLAELSAFRNPRFLLMVGVASIGMSGFFAFYSYIGPMVTNLTGTGEHVVPWILVTVGLGMTAGNLFGGRMADASIRRATLTAFVGVIAVFVAMTLTAQFLPAVFVAGFAAAFFTSIFSPAVQTRLVQLAPRSPAIAAAMNHSALNLGNSLGAFLGGAAIAATLDYRSQLVVGTITAVAGLALCLLSFAIDDRGGRGRARL